MAFAQKPTAKITATITGTTDKITIDGTDAAETSETNAKEQIDKILDVVGKSVSTTGMTQTIVKEVAE
ncbi:MAG: hypothetical protein IKT98_10400 [Selenomonadaceae bacterium]|nr:hypothetical protein [Selenomonadaceae bacterium]